MNIANQSVSTYKLATGSILKRTTTRRTLLLQAEAGAQAEFCFVEDGQPDISVYIPAGQGIQFFPAPINAIKVLAGNITIVEGK